MKDVYRKPVLIIACILLGIGAVAMIVGIFVKDAGNWLTWIGAGFLIISMIGNAVVITDKDDAQKAVVAPVAPAPVATPVAKALAPKATTSKAVAPKAAAKTSTTPKKTTTAKKA